MLVVYLAINLGIGWWCARRRQQATSGGFFLGGGRVAWWAMALSFFATSTSSLSFMALPARSYSSDWKSFGAAPAQALAGVLLKVGGRMSVVIGYGVSLAFGTGAEKKDLRGLTLWDPR